MLRGENRISQKPLPGERVEMKGGKELTVLHCAVW